MYACYYLLVWMEDSGCWWTADECEERSLKRATAYLKGRNPRLCRPGRPWAVVAHDELEEALTRKPTVEAYSVLKELAAA
jgi:hypothetical protein